MPTLNKPEVTPAMLEVQRETSLPIPTEDQIHTWVSAALLEPGRSLLVRYVDSEESQALNRAYRQRDKPTNVLSFEFDLPAGVEDAHLGDLVICVPVVEAEARAQNKRLEAHHAHMVVHGLLHLQGYDHELETEAQNMEAVEIEILQRLGYANPYE